MQYQYSQRSPIDELHSMYPGADREIIRSLFMANNNNFERTKVELSQLMNQSNGSRQGSYQENVYSNRTSTNSTTTRSYSNNYDGSDLAGQYQTSNSYGGHSGHNSYGGQNVPSMSSNPAGGKKKTGFVKKLKCGFAGLVQKGKKGILVDSSNYNEIDEDM